MKRSGIRDDKALTFPGLHFITSRLHTSGRRSTNAHPLNLEFAYQTRYTRNFCASKPLKIDIQTTNLAEQYAKMSTLNDLAKGSSQ